MQIENSLKGITEKKKKLLMFILSNHKAQVVLLKSFRETAETKCGV